MDKTSGYFYTLTEVQYEAREYLRTIQKLESETKECYGQAEYLKNAINNLSNQNAIETVEELIVDLMDEASDYAIHRVHLINELLNVDDPMQYTLLHYRYCLGYGWNKIAYKLKVSVGFVKNLHGEALKSLDRYLEECCNAEEE